MAPLVENVYTIVKLPQLWKISPFMDDGTNGGR